MRLFFDKGDTVIYLYDKKKYTVDEFVGRGTGMIRITRAHGFIVRYVHYTEISPCLN